MTRLEDHLGVVEAACEALDGVGGYGISEGDASGLLVLHGLAMYARETARSSALLLREGRTLSASALARIVIEHAVLAQWVGADPNGRGRLFLQQGQVEHARWFEVLLDAYFDPRDPGFAALNAMEKREGLVPKPKNVDEVFHTPRNLFGDSESGRRLYLTYRELSRFVHPSVTTFARYTAQSSAGGQQLVNDLQQDQDPEAASFYLASAIVMCALPYLDVLEGHEEAAASLRRRASAAAVLTALN